MNLSSICFGCEPLGGVDWGNVNIGDIKKAIFKALDLGVNFFDTADVYGLGLSEERLSKILGNKRFEVVISSKGGMQWSFLENSSRAKIIRNSSSAYIEMAVDMSLKRLRLECIPIYFIHWPDLNTPFAETFTTLAKLQSKGKIASIGCSNFSLAEIKAASIFAKIDYVQMPVNILNGPIENETISYFEENDIAVIAYNVLSYGLLTGKYNNLSSFGPLDRRSRLTMFQKNNYLESLEKIEKLSKQALEVNLPLSHFAIRWVLEQKNIISAIIGIKNEHQIIDNFSAIKN
jgi:myo-inositol catabolism protein IolS